MLISDKNNKQINLNENELAIFNKLKAIKVNYFSYFSWPDTSLIRDLEEIQTTNLNRILNHLFLQMIQEKRITDPVAFLNHMASVIPLEKLLEITHSTLPELTQTAKQRCKEAEHYLEIAEPTPHFNFYAQVLVVRDGLVTVIESLIAEFNLGKFFTYNEDENQYGRKQLSSMIYQYTSLTASLLPSLGVATGGKILAIFALSIAGLSLAWPYIKPVPANLPGQATNWTKEVLEGGFIPQANADTLKKIREALKNNQHPLLIGPPRGGKTLTAKAYHYAMAKGEFEESKDWVGHHVNMTSILGDSLLKGGVQTLNEMNLAMGPHRDKILLTIDELHNACKGKAKAAELLLTYLDEGGAFRHVIGITTDVQYKKYFIDRKTGEPIPFAKRFCPIHVEGTNYDETIRILNDKVLASLSKPIVTEDAIKTIYEASNRKGPQPHTAILLLKECIKATRTSQISEKEKEMDDISSQISRLYSDMAATRGKISIDRLEELEKNRNNLAEAVNESKLKKENLFQVKNLFDQVTAASYRSILKISAIAQRVINPKGKEERELKLYLLLQAFAPVLENYLDKESKELGIQLKIDKELVNQCLEKVKAPQIHEHPKTKATKQLRIRYPKIVK